MRSYLVRSILRSEEGEGGSVGRDISLLHVGDDYVDAARAAARTPLQELDAEAAAFAAAAVRAATLVRRLGAPCGGDGDGSGGGDVVEVAAALAAAAAAHAAVASDAQCELTAEYAALLAYFGEDPTLPSEELFTTLSQFADDLAAARTEGEAAAQATAKAAAAAAFAAARRPSSTSTSVKTAAACPLPRRCGCQKWSSGHARVCAHRE